MHEGERLTGFPRLEDRVGIDLVLGFGEDADGAPAPVRVGALGVGLDDSLGFVSELSVLVEIDTVDEERRIEGLDLGGVAPVGGTPMLIKQEAEHPVSV